MITGHAALGFLVVALLGYRRGINPEKCIKLGLFGAMFAALPDIDVVFAASEIYAIINAGPGGFIESFWGATSNFHRGITHSMVTLALASAAFIYFRKSQSPKLGVGVTVLSAVYGFLFAGIEAAMVMTVFMPVGLLISSYSIRYLDRKEFSIAAIPGLLMHPVGDIFTGTPPDFFFPLNFTVINSRIVLNQDPVLNLLSILFIELTLVLLAVLTAILLRNHDLREHMTPAPLIGIAYAPLFFVVPQPTLSSPYVFVIFAAGLGFLANFLAHYFNGTDLEGNIFDMHSLNFVLTMSVASLTYLATYLIL